ncbi:MAG: hypothetical protein JST28_23860 [Acidobacteria bacterium]|nr:hypothetical protein [Acidobacteriota bacterium]
MSIFKGIANVEHTFAAWAEKELAKLFKDAPRIEQVADAILTYVGPALQTIVTLEAGAPAGAIVGKVVREAQSALTAASGAIYDFGPTPSAGSIIGGVKDNLTGLLAAGHVSNPASVSTVNQVVSELDLLVAALSKVSAAAATPMTPKKPQAVAPATA